MLMVISFLCGALKVFDNSFIPPKVRILPFLFVKYSTWVECCTFLCTSTPNPLFWIKKWENVYFPHSLFLYLCVPRVSAEGSFRKPDKGHISCPLGNALCAEVKDMAFQSKDDQVLNTEHYPHSKCNREWRYNDITMCSGVIRFLANKHAANKYMVAFDVGDADATDLVDELAKYTWSVSHGSVFSMSPYYFHGVYIPLPVLLRRWGFDPSTIRTMRLPQHFEQ